MLIEWNIHKRGAAWNFMLSELNIERNLAA
jgi:hypothetical protein